MDEQLELDLFPQEVTLDEVAKYLDRDRMSDEMLERLNFTLQQINYQKKQQDYFSELYLSLISS